MNEPAEPAPEGWFIAFWPDGEWCDWEERGRYYGHKSDDYEKRRVVTFEPYSGEPVEMVKA